LKYTKHELGRNFDVFLNIISLILEERIDMETDKIKKVREKEAYNMSFPSLTNDL
jgi:hypothetical protein